MRDSRTRCFPVWRYHPVSPTPPGSPPTQMSPTVGTRSSKPCSPISLTDHLHTCRRGSSGRTPRGCCARRSPHNLLRATGVLAGDRYSHSRGATLRRKIVKHPSSIVSGRNENRFCDYRLTGRGPLRGFDCGPTLSDTARRPSLETFAGRRPDTLQSWKSWVDQRSHHVWKQRLLGPFIRIDSHGRVGGFRLNNVLEQFP